MSNSSTEQTILAQVIVNANVAAEAAATAVAAAGSVEDKAPLVSPAFTGIPTAPTAAADTNDTQIATTAYFDSQKGIADGVATLDGSGQVPIAQIPAGVASGVASLDGGGQVPIAQLPAGVGDGVASLDGGGKVPIAQIPAGVASGVASLDSGGQVPLAQIPVSSLPNSSNCGLFSIVSGSTLKFVPYMGDIIKINGDLYNIPSAGIAGLGSNCFSGNNVFLDGVAGSNLSADTLYYAYGFVNSGVVTADFSTTINETSATAGNIGVEIKTGDDTRSLIGMVYGKSGAFYDDGQNRYIRSWFNRGGSPRSLFSSSAFNRTVVAGGTGDKISTDYDINVLVWGNESVILNFTGGTTNASAGGTCQSLIYVDAGSSVYATASKSKSVGAGDNCALACGLSISFSKDSPGQGRHTFSAYGVATVGTGTWVAYSGMSGSII